MRTGRSRAPACLGGKGEGGWMEWKSVTQCAPKITFQFPRIFSPGKGGCGGCGLVFRVKGRKGSCSLPIPRAKGKGDRTRFCTPCTGGQISGAAGSQAGLSHTDGADPGHRGGARQSGGDRREDMKETRTSILHYACPPFYLATSQVVWRDVSPSCIVLQTLAVALST